MTVLKLAEQAPESDRKETSLQALGHAGTDAGAARLMWGTLPSSTAPTRPGTIHLWP